MARAHFSEAGMADQGAQHAQMQPTALAEWVALTLVHNHPQDMCAETGAKIMHSGIRSVDFQSGPLRVVRFQFVPILATTHAQRGL